MTGILHGKRFFRFLAWALLLAGLGADMPVHGQTYCNPSYPNGCAVSNNRITNVQIGTINHSPPNCTVHDYTSISTQIPAGVPTNITVTSEGWCGVGVAVDFNSDGDFNDPGEILALPGYQANQVAIYAMSITVPLSVPPGSYRMRVYNRLANSGNGTPADSPCGTYGYGSWDDYTLVVYHQCATVTGSSATPAIICSSGTSSLSVSYTSVSPATVKWYNEQGIQVGTGNPFTSPTLTSTTTLYAAVDNGLCDTPRVPVTVIVTPPVQPPLAVTPADTTICEGKIVRITATRTTQTDSVVAEEGSYTISKAPINGSGVNSASELIYTASELNIAGRITNIGFFKKNTNTTFNPGNVTIYMKNTTAATVGATASTAGYVQVYSGVWPNTGVAANTWNNIILNTPFDYLGGNNNLAILVVRTGGTSNLLNAPTYRASSLAPAARNSYFISGAWVSGTSPMTSDTLRPDIKIRYQVNPGITWAPAANLFRDNGLTQPIAASDTSNIVYAHPSVTTTYHAHSNWNGCLSAGYINATVHILDTVHVIRPDTICAGQSYSFGTQTLTAPGTYQQTFQGTNSCDSVVTLNLWVKPYITNSVTVNICQGQTYTFNGITYTTSQTGLKDTFATAGCDSIVTLNLVVNPNITPTFNIVSNICNGATAPLLPAASTNGITGTWSPATVSNTATGTYTFTPGTGQCATTATVTVTVNPIITTTFNPIPAICAGATPPVLPTTSANGITGTWSPATVSNSATGTYTFTPGAGQCATTATLTVTVNPNVTPAFNAVPAICSGATPPVLPTTSTNGIPGTWSPATVSNTATATYTFTPSAGQCAVTTTLTVTVNPIVTPTFSAVAAICAGAAAPVLPATSNNGIPGTWSPATVSNTATGTYTFTPAAGQCASTATLTVTVHPNVTPAFNAIAPICFGSTPPVLPGTSTNGIAGSWSPASVNNTATTTYTFTPNAGLCATTATMTITVKPLVYYNDNRTICPSALPYTWNGIPNANTGTMYTATAANGCDSIVTLGLTVMPAAVVTYKDTLSCGPLFYRNQTFNVSTILRDTVKSRLGCDSSILVTNITIYPNNPYTKTIDTAGCASVIFEGNTYYESTQLDVMYRNIHGCDSVRRIVNINVDDFDLILTMTPENPYEGEPVLLETSSNAGDNYTVDSWTPLAWFANQHRKSQQMPAKTEGEIIVYGQSVNGCPDTGRVELKIRPLNYGVFMPNAFSPNGDGNNDKFGPSFYMDRAYVIKTFRVYNRWGQLVYSASNAVNGAWDGTRNDGQPADIGNYGYFMVIRFIDGKEVQLKGDVTLIR